MIRRCQVCQAVTDGDYCPECGAHVTSEVGWDGPATQPVPPPPPPIVRGASGQSAPSPPWPAGGGQAGYPGPGATIPQGPPPQRSRSWMLYAVLGLLLVGVVAAVAYVLGNRGTDSSVANSATSTSTAPNSSATPSSADSDSATSTSEPDATSEPDPVYVGAGGRVCPPTRRSLGPIGTAVADNDHTSCPFAVSVRSAYAHSGATPPEMVVVNAYSPVKKQWYAMTCSGEQPVVCRGGNDARVLLFEGLPAGGG